MLKDKHLFLQSCKGKYKFIVSSTIFVMLQKLLKKGQLYKRIIKELFLFQLLVWWTRSAQDCNKLELALGVNILQIYSVKFRTVHHFLIVQLHQSKETPVTSEPSGKRK
jgi:hypothetical protein